MKECAKKEKCHLHEKVSWHNSIEDIKGFGGCILSNELIDNFSVHRVVMQDGLMEVFVDHIKGFTEVLQPAGKEINEYLGELNINLPKGFQTEINLEAIGWIKEISEFLRKGYIITIDYGYPSSKLYNEYRSLGTLRCYHKHSVHDDPYVNIGEQDITAHVNFSALNYWGLKNGLDLCGFTDQAHFLLSLGIADHLCGEQTCVDIKSVTKLAKLRHNLLIGMGSKFKVLIQGKDVLEKGLLGLKHKSGLLLEDIGIMEL